MSTSRHRLTLTERRMPVEPIYHLHDLQERYLHYHQAKGSAKATISHHTFSFALLNRFLTEADVTPTNKALSTESMQTFAIWLRATPVKAHRGTTTRSETGVHGMLKNIRAFVHWLSDEGYVERKIKVPVPQLPQTLFPILSDDQLSAIWRSRYLTGPSPLAIRNRALIGLMLDTGLRRAEVAGLTLRAVELDDCLLSVMGKGNKQRRVPFSTGVRALLLEWLRVRGAEDGSLFWLRDQSIRTVFRRIQEELGLDRFHPHQIRHQSATMLVRANVDLATVQRILGHSDISTTLQYLSLNDADVRAKHAAASPVERMQELLPDEDKRQRRKRLTL